MSDAARPDGTDPRVLTVPDDAPEVLIARNNSSAKAYHTNRCATVKQMTDPKRVAQSVAEWNNHEKCARCRRIDSGEDYERPGAGQIRVDSGYHTVTPIQCLAIRALALRGSHQREIAEQFNIGRSTVARHISGDCTCDHYGHTVHYDDDMTAHTRDDGGLPANIRDGHVVIPAITCGRIRQLLVDAPLSVQPVADLFDASDNAVRKHAKNLDTCPHDHADEHPPVEYDHAAQEWRHAHE